jgi:hypothetical protein
MIDSEFIIKYTNALYSTPSEFAPRYDEFRDMFSSGQIKSKEWLVEELHKINYDYLNTQLIIVGAWYGTLGMMIHCKFPNTKITMLDIDPRCGKYIHNIIYDNSHLNSITGDMYKHSYTEDIIINTSCEHIEDVQEWLSLIPKNKIVVLQSNNYINGSGHVNCVYSEEDFIKQTGIEHILYSGKLELPIYTRYMVIGRT